MKKESGITLIALVITIIVLLILAGISISTIVGDNGIINKASNAKEATIIGKEKEILGIAFSACQTETMFEEEILPKDLKDEIEKYNETVEVSKNGNNFVIKYLDTGNIYILDDSGKVVEKTDNSGETGNEDEVEKFLVDCYECKGTGYQTFVNDETSYGMLYCDNHGFQEEVEIVLFFRKGWCDSCNKEIEIEIEQSVLEEMGEYEFTCECEDKIIVNSDDCVEYEIPRCTICKENFTKEECDTCNHTGQLLVECTKCFDEDRYYEKYCENCKSDNIVKGIIYNYRCPICEMGGYVTEIETTYCEDDECEYTIFEEEERYICGNCGSIDVSEEYIECPICVHYDCTTCRDYGYIITDEEVCYGCSSTDINIERSYSYYCPDCGYTSSYNTNCVYCEDIELEKEWDGEERIYCGSCESEDIGYKEIPCPECNN